MGLYPSPRRFVLLPGDIALDLKLDVVPAQVFANHFLKLLGQLARRRQVLRKPEPGWGFGMRWLFLGHRDHVRRAGGGKGARRRLDFSPIMCVHGYMSIEPKTGHRSAIAPAKGLRRRVIFELDAEQLPLLDGIRERHGSTRAGLIAALEAEAAGGELGTQLAAAKARAEQAKRALERGKKEASTARRKGDTEAKAAVEDRKALAAELEDLRRQLAEAEEEARQSEADYEEALEEFREEVSDLEERAVEWLFCARCGEWVSAGEWIWEPIEGGGQYAYHERCGDHKPGLLPSSWLAQRP